MLFTMEDLSQCVSFRGMDDAPSIARVRPQSCRRDRCLHAEPVSPAAG